jgi:hypothetical protein
MADNETTILISFGALMVSVFSLGWNFYRDVVLKARVRVTIDVSNIHHADSVQGPFISINVTNLGPGVIICESIRLERRSCLGFLGWRVSRLLHLRYEHAHVMHDYTNPYSSSLPKKLDMGEKLSLLLPFKEDASLSVDPTHVGILDSFGRLHWATRSSLSRAKAQFFQEFPRKANQACGEGQTHTFRKRVTDPFNPQWAVNGGRSLPYSSGS